MAAYAKYFEENFGYFLAGIILYPFLIWGCYQIDEWLGLAGFVSGLLYTLILVISTVVVACYQEDL